MQAGKKYSLIQTLSWTQGYIYAFIGWNAVVVGIYYFLGLDWMVLPWQPISLVGVAVAFYLGFKNNSAYERLWEGRKIWGGIVNTSRTFTVFARDYVTNEFTGAPASEDELASHRKTIVHRHVAWLKALTFQLRVVKAWEHNNKFEKTFRKQLGTDPNEDHWPKIKPYLSEEEYNYVMSKGNKASHLLSLQSKHMKELKEKGLIDDFRHMEMGNVVKELYTLQGKSERIKNFPFPRQYATVNYYFVWLFIIILPCSMLQIFARENMEWFIWLAVPFSTIVSWVFLMMEMIGEYSENPFEGLYNDVPISSMANDIEIDIRQMLEETNLPTKIEPITEFKVLV